jgi:hypothetical protein
MTSKIFLGASSKCSTKDLLFDDPSLESCPQWPELLLPVEYGHLENLVEG